MVDTRKTVTGFRVVREGPKVDDKGYVHAPRGPGLGMELDWEYVDAHTVAIL